MRPVRAGPAFAGLPEGRRRRTETRPHAAALDEPDVAEAPGVLALGLALRVTLSQGPYCPCRL